ncbi:type I methionyl aminopeptidase [Candidatus Borkfalkia ceftriaxoniphila]|jgi:methionine aminopeptidase, type I|uniref:Methionine aminopeptidase n=1 Tax=Candidatus Borkfalkia ceftriaxoniphila TaxID=2508949 RepID=A0A4Q2KBL3_9FIRM|nr:type I methionyl aminopeptidase [Candidatus Borkfalkia ceftriaxoniphila]RXZ61270.1 type I methionyl aminopeptidase [Candidatus Borkfalkia ceftriaxoniphila]
MIFVKTEQEIDLMREPCRIMRDALDYLGNQLKAGMTTADVNALADDYIRSRGAIPSCLGYCGYPASVCVSVNEQVVHGIPGERIIRDGDIVSLDFCAYKNGYHADAARTFLVGDVSEEKRRLVRVTEECFFKAVENLKAGTPLYDIGAAVQKHAESNGYSVVRALVGHGIGKEMHEDPAVPNFGKAGTGVRLKAGTVLCIEPMINMGGYQVDFLSDGWTVETRDKQPSAHYENTVVIREDGVEILTL